MPLAQHLKLHTSQLKQKSNLPNHPLHKLTQHTDCPRQMKPTIFNNWNLNTTNITNTIQPLTNDMLKQNVKTIHNISVQEYLLAREPNPLLPTNQPLLRINKTEETLPRKVRRTPAQLCIDKSPVLLT